MNFGVFAQLSKYLLNPADFIRKDSTKIIVSNLAVGGSNGYIPDVIPPSPNAVFLGRFGNIALNLSSELPNLPIPLYTGTEISLFVPISLQYHYMRAIVSPKMRFFWAWYDSQFWGRSHSVLA